MKHPRLPATVRRSISVYGLDGGINTNELPTQINDNQLTDLLNLWWKDGALQTRPGFCAVGSSAYLNIPTGSKYKCFKTEIFHDNDGTLYPIMALLLSSGSMSNIYFIYADSTGAIRNAAGGGLFTTSTPRITYNGDISHLSGLVTFSHNGAYYVFIKTNTLSGIYRFYSNVASISVVGDNELYIPLVLSSATACDTYYSPCEGNRIEGFNALTPYYRAVYSTYNLKNPSDAVDDSGNRFHGMIYALPAAPVPGTVITAKHTMKNGTVATHSVTVPAEGYAEESEAAEDGYQMRFLNRHICFYNGVTLVQITSADYLKDNLEITSTYDNSSAREKILGCSISNWFGGSAGGISSGTRMFLSGNSDFPAELFYSGLNNPLYFSEKFSAVVGDISEPITAFGKQGNMLVIFKKREIYSAIYAQDTTITADDVISGRISDLSVAMAYFPITQIHSGVGCDCPESLVLCRNKLVWATSDKKIYTLASSDEYSQTNVYELSRMISVKLAHCTSEQLRNAKAIQSDSCYILAVGKKMFVLNFGAYAFTHVYSYSDESKAQKSLSWYYWELPENIEWLFADEEKFGVYLSVGSGLCYAAASYTADCDKMFSTSGETSVPIPVMFSTKKFRFSGAHSLKKTEQVYLCVAAESVISLNISSLTDSNFEDCVNTAWIDGGMKIKHIKFRPNCRNSTNYGLCVRTQGHAMFDSLTVNYKTVRSVR